jgi:pimeloyl-ACP methyl ester carboxylesterase
MAEQPAVTAHRIAGGRLEVYRLPGGPGTPLLVLGGVETGLRPLTGTEHVLARRWEPRTPRRPVVVMGRPIADDPADAERLMHPRLMADAVAGVLRDLPTPVAVEAESGGGRITLWLAVDHPELVARLVLASVASETPAGSPMAHRLEQWISLAEANSWGHFFGRMAVQMRPADADGAGSGSFTAAAQLQPRPSTPERFIGELKATLDPGSFVTARLREIGVPALILAGGRDQVVPEAATRQVADGIPGALFRVDPASGHTVRSSFHGYQELVEAFLAEGDA